VGRFRLEKDAAMRTHADKAVGRVVVVVALLLVAAGLAVGLNAKPGPLVGGNGGPAPSGDVVLVY
jgi:hypothetical protein